MLLISSVFWLPTLVKSLLADWSIAFLTDWSNLGYQDGRFVVRKMVNSWVYKMVTSPSSRINLGLRKGHMLGMLFLVTLSLLPHFPFGPSRVFVSRLRTL